MVLLFSAHMWFDGVIVDADTTEDQSGKKHDKVKEAGREMLMLFSLSITVQSDYTLCSCSEFLCFLFVR